MNNYLHVSSNKGNCLAIRGDLVLIGCVDTGRGAFADLGLGVLLIIDGVFGTRKFSLFSFSLFSEFSSLVENGNLSLARLLPLSSAPQGGGLGPRSFVSQFALVFCVGV